jgi:hypothetical protein
MEKAQLEKAFDEKGHIATILMLLFLILTAGDPGVLRELTSRLLGHPIIISGSYDLSYAVLLSSLCLLIGRN